jgi:uncharacterized membrane protein
MGSRQDLPKRGSQGSLTSLALGATLMYYLDSQAGRRRRALLRDQLVHAGRLLREGRRVTARDVVNRAQGVWADAARLLRAEPSSDAELVERVRAKLGRVVSHSHAVRVSVAEGRVELTGPILAREVDALLESVRRVPGVREVHDRLTVYERGEGISALQGGHPRPGDRFELMQDNWSPTARVITGTLGAGLIACGTRAGGAIGLVANVLGAGLALRAATNRPLSTVLGIGQPGRGIEVHKAIHIDAPVKKVFEFWADYQNFPRCMSRVRKVEVLDETRSRWLVTGPAGAPVEWIAEATKIVPNALMEWRCVADCPVQHWGTVRFDANGYGGTRVNIRLFYLPPAGVVGHALASLFRSDPKSEMDQDLMRMKTAIETGHLPHDAAMRAGQGSLSAQGSLGSRTEAAWNGRPLSGAE